MVAPEMLLLIESLPSVPVIDFGLLAFKEPFTVKAIFFAPVNVTESVPTPKIKSLPLATELYSAPEMEIVSALVTPVIMSLPSPEAY